MSIGDIRIEQPLQCVPRAGGGVDAKYDVTKSGRPASARSATPAPTSSSGNTAFAAKAESIVGHINYMKKQLDEILVNYPPFFPPGSPQRPDLIKRIRGIQEDIGKLCELSDGAIRNSIVAALSENAGDKEIAGALDQLTDIGNGLSENAGPVRDRLQPGRLLNMRV